MISLQNWLMKPRTTVRIDTAIPGWMKALHLRFVAKAADLRPRFEVIDRLALGGKKSLLLVTIEGQRLLIGVGDEVSPSVTPLRLITETAMRPVRRTAKGRARRTRR